MGRAWLFAATAVIVTGAALALPRGHNPLAPVAEAQPARAPAAAIPPAARQAYFGELHLHTLMSFDAWTFGTKVTPDQAYKFARGETVMVPSAQVATQHSLPADQPVPARRAWPLDFAAVTDHAEYLGAVAQLEIPDSPFSKSRIGQQLKTGGRAGFFIAGEAVRGVNNESTADFRAAALAADGWNVEMRAANQNYQPGKFTTLIGYEWTATPGNGVHMHRNVLFNGDHAPAPFSSVDSNKPQDLWNFMAGVRRQGFEVLAIPHNANLSDGRDFSFDDWDGHPIDKAYAAQQQLNEPLVEMTQTKGTSETTPQLSPSDEFAGFEIMDRIYAGETAPKQNGSYVRQGYGRGLQVQARTGVNPFKMGVVGGSDIHNGLSVSDEAGATASSYGLDPATMTPRGVILQRALGQAGEAVGVRPNGQRENDPVQFSSAGVTGVWAEQNTREAIFAALKRKETFATSGTRIRVRMFGGWNLTPATLKQADWVAKAYASGVPMGGDLKARGSAKAPTFAVQAMKDPSGANLDRVQIVKVWLAADGYKEKVFDVALSGDRKVDPRTGKAPPVGNSVDLKTGKVGNQIGAVILTTVWTDPEFDPKTPAVYYARVLEVPSPRWTTLLALRTGQPIPKDVPATIQERAWTSPIWYTP